MVAVGLSLPDPHSVTESARVAEDLGFDYVAVGEHLFHHGPTPNSFVQLAAAAAVTSRIRLVSAVCVLPLYPAALAAKLAVTVDQVSGGRFELGVGAGGEFPHEFWAAGVDPATRFRRLDEGLTVVRLLFSGHRVSFAGEFTDLRGVVLDPPPVRPGGPPIWVGGRRAGAMTRAGRFASVWLPYMVTPATLHAGLAQVREAAVDAGRAARDVRGAAFVFLCVDADRSWARQAGIDSVGRMYRQDFTSLADQYLVLGNPNEVVTRLREYADSGAETIIVHLAAPASRRDRVLRTFVEEVLPELRRTQQR